MWVGLLPEPLTFLSSGLAHLLCKRPDDECATVSQAWCRWSLPPTPTPGHQKRMHVAGLGRGRSLQADLAALGIWREPPCAGVAAEPLDVRCPSSGLLLSNGWSCQGHHHASLPGQAWLLASSRGLCTNMTFASGSGSAWSWTSSDSPHCHHVGPTPDLKPISCPCANVDRAEGRPAASSPAVLGRGWRRVGSVLRRSRVVHEALRCPEGEIARWLGWRLGWSCPKCPGVFSRWGDSQGPRFVFH